LYVRKSTAHLSLSLAFAHLKSTRKVFAPQIDRDKSVTHETDRQTPPLLGYLSCDSAESGLFLCEGEHLSPLMRGSLSVGLVGFGAAAAIARRPRFPTNCRSVGRGGRAGEGGSGRQPLRHRRTNPCPAAHTRPLVTKGYF
jgi:hypothetical protein